MTEEEYRNLPSDKYFNYSMLSSVSRQGGHSLIKKQEDTPFLKMGSLLHTLNLSRDIFDKKYRVIRDFIDLSETYEKLYISLKSALLQGLIGYNDIKEFNEYYKEFSLQTSKDLNLWANITNDQTRLKKILDSDFLKFISEVFVDPQDNRICIGTEQFFIAELSHKALAKHKATSKYFQNNTKDIQILTEYPVLFKIKEDHFKILLDLVYIDHKNKTINAVDLKTSSKSHVSFDLDFFIWRYDIQSALIIKALEELRRKEFKNYTILLPEYIFISKTIENYSVPIIYEIPYDVCKRAFTGYYMTSGVYNKGIFELVEDIKHYRKTKQYSLDKKISNLGNVISLSSRFINKNIKLPQLDRNPFERMENAGNELERFDPISYYATTNTEIFIRTPESWQQNLIRD